MSVKEKRPRHLHARGLSKRQNCCCRLLRPTAIITLSTLTTIIVALRTAFVLSVQAAINAITFVIEAPVYSITPIVQPAVDAITLSIETA